MEGKRYAYRILIGKTQRDCLKDISKNGMIVLKWVLIRQAGWCGLKWSGSPWGQVASYCECGNGLQDSI
jgi:hypothetical protein